MRTMARATIDASETSAANWAFVIPFSHPGFFDEQRQTFRGRWVQNPLGACWHC